MKRIALILGAGVMLLTSCNNEKKTEPGNTDNASTSTETTPKDEPWVAVDSATAMQKMIEYGTPGPMHKMLEGWNGTWSGETTMWEYDGAPASKSTGTAVNTMIMGGKYQSSKHSGDMMGMPFEGMSIMGYDNATKQFTSTWIDTWSTGITTFTGSWDEASKSLTMSGTYPDILRPGKECKMREVFKLVDDNNHILEMYGPDPKTGKEFKMMEMKMSRKK